MWYRDEEDVLLHKPFSASTECNNVRFLLLAQDVFFPPEKNTLNILK